VRSAREAREEALRVLGTRRVTLERRTPLDAGVGGGEDGTARLALVAHGAHVVCVDVIDGRRETELADVVLREDDGRREVVGVVVVGRVAIGHHHDRTAHELVVGVALVGHWTDGDDRCVGGVGDELEVHTERCCRTRRRVEDLVLDALLLGRIGDVLRRHVGARERRGVR
jgi:hypothetical protein